MSEIYDVYTGFPVIDRICNADTNPENALKLFQNRDISAEKLATVCRDHGQDISASSIRTYRRYYHRKAYA